MKKINVFLMLLLATVMFSACSSSGGSSNPTTTTGTTTPGTNPLSATSTITGSVSAPAATLAKLQRKSFFDRFAGLFVSEVTAQVAGGLQPVPNTNILAFRIDNAGNPVGDVLASVTTDASGNYSLNLPAGTGLSSDIILQASATTTPQAVNTVGTLNCPAASPALNLTPAAQVATIAIIQNIAANGGDLANFTIDEIAGFVAEVQSLAATVPVGASTSDTIASITSSLSSNLTTSLAAISSVGQTAAPASIGGDYNLVEYKTTMGLGGITREIGKGSITLDPANQSFVSSESFESISLTSACAVGNSCQRTFTRGQGISIQPKTVSGTYQLSGNGKIVFTVPPSTEDPEGDVSLGMINQDGTLIALSLFEDGDTALIVAVKEGSGLSAASVDGSIFAGHEMINNIPANGSFTNTWTGHSTEIFTGTETFTGSTFDGGGTGKVMTQDFTCTTTVGTGCGLSATLSATTITDVAGTDPASFTVSPEGLLTLTFVSDGAVDTGHISPDSNFLVGSFVSPSDGDIGLSLFVKKGTGLNNATLTGTYNVGAITEFMGTIANDEVGILTGAMTFSGTDTFSFSALALVGDRRECVGTGSCPATQMNQSSEIFTDPGTYTVEPDGDFTVTIPVAGSTTPDIFRGTVSPDGKVIIWNTVSDNKELEPGVFDSGRTLGIGFRQ